MHRPTIGLIALVLLAVGLAAYWQDQDAVAGACLRIGAVTSIFWLAQPQLVDLPRWALLTSGAALIVVARWPKLLFVALLSALAIWILGPRYKPADPRQ